jgi:hypothetical protein
MEANKVQLLRGIRLDLKPNDLLFTNPTTTAICQEFTDIKCISITTTAICQDHAKKLAFYKVLLKL